MAEREPDPDEIDRSVTGDASPAPAAGVSVPDNDLVGVIGPDGRAGSIPRHQVAEALGRGYRLESPEQTDQRATENREGDHQAQTFIESAASTMSLGATDALAGLVSPEAAKHMKERRELNREGAIGGALFGAVNPYGAGGLIGKAGKLAGAGVEAAVGGGIAGRVAGATAQGVTEGGLFGYGEGVSQLGLTQDPLTAERVVSTLGGNVLFGAAAGGVMGGAGGILGEAATAGREALGKVGAAERARAGVEVAPEVSALDREAAKAAHEVETGKLGAAREAEMRDAYQASRQYNEVLESSWLKGGDSRFKRLMQATRKAVRNSLDSENAFVRYKGARTLDALDKQAQAIREYAEADVAARQKAATVADAEGVVKAARAEAAPGKNGTINMRARVEAPVEPPPPISMDPKVHDLLDVNEALRKRIETFGKAPSSPLLDQLDAHLDALAHPGKKPMSQQMAEQMGGAFGAKAGFAVGGMPGGMIGYHLGSKAAAAVFEGGLGGKLRAGVAKSQRTMMSAADTFLSASAKVGKVAPVLSTRVLAAATFAPPGYVPVSRPPMKTSNALLTAFKDREGEIRSQTTAGPTGKAVLLPGAAAGLHDRLAGLWAVDPKMADMIEAAATQRLTFLADKLPQRPTVGAFGGSIGPDRWQPSDLDMRKFARYVAATDDPNGVLKRLGAGRMSPEDAEAFRIVYPEMWTTMKTQIMKRLPEVQETLPFRKRLMLSLFFDAPVDPSQDPTTASMLQKTYAAEPGSSGGTGQPVPKMGNTKKLAPDPTPAQRMAG